MRTLGKAHPIYWTELHVYTQPFEIQTKLLFEYNIFRLKMYVSFFYGTKPLTEIMLTYHQ